MLRLQALALPGYQFQTQQLPSEAFGAHAALVLDVGYSSTHAVPLFGQQPLNYAVKRLDIGGKALASYMKELVSQRAFNVMDDTLIVEDMVRKSCFVSLDLHADLRLARRRPSPLLRHFVYPNGCSRLHGTLRDPERKENSNDEADATDDDACVALMSERVAVPEVLFSPSYIGLEQAGVAELCAQAIASCPGPLRSVMWNNILVVGGNALFPGFGQRLQAELRCLAPTDCKVRVRIAPDPVSAAWHGGALLGCSRYFNEMVVTREEWQEHGERICRSKFQHD